MNLVENLLENYLKTDGFKYKMYIDSGIDYDKALLKEFVDFCLDFLKISEDTQNLRVVFSNQKDKFTTYAYYDLQANIAAVYCTGRAILDVLRSLAHELVHYKQDLRGEITPEQTSDKNDGVPIENEANAIAGVIMREFGRKHRELY